MIAFTLRRLGSAILVMIAMSVLVFLIFFATPGIDPARQMAGRNPRRRRSRRSRRSSGSISRCRCST